MSNILPAGTPAPDFTLHATPDQTRALKGLRGRPVILTKRARSAIPSPSRKAP
jgi:peroxiredoxin